MSMDRHFRDVWGKLFPGVDWPAKESIALTYMANQILALRGELEAMREPGPHPMRARAEIVRAHDLFIHTLRDPKICPDEETRDMLMDFAETLHWVLVRDDEGNPVPRHLAAIEMALAATGQGVVHVGKSKLKM